MLSIGPFEFDVPFVQAALSGYSDLPMRRLARRYGAPYALNEVMLDKLVLQPGKKRKDALYVAEDDHPVGGQLMGANPDEFAPAAAALAAAGYDIIDINFGCPVKKVLGRCRGGYLLSQPETALDIVRRVFDAVGSTHPVTLKMRRGMDDDDESERNFFTILDGALAIGASAITVHGRTVRQRYVGPSQWSFLARVKRHAGNRVILGSGDLFSADACVRMIRETGVDGVTIARGCIGNPWIFEECRALWRGEEIPAPPSIARQSEAIAVHWQEVVGHYGEEGAVGIMRKFGIKYAEHHPLSRQVRDAFIDVKTPAGFRQVLNQWYDSTAEWPPVTRRVGHGDLIAAGACAKSPGIFPSQRMSKPRRKPVQKYHDRVAHTYDQSYEDEFWQWHDALTWDYLKPFLPTDLSRKVVDLGCGTGKWSAKLAKSGFDVTCVDISSRMLDQARVKIAPQSSRTAFLQADLCDLSALPTGGFGCAIALGDPIGCTDSPAKAMKEIRRILAEDGVLIATFDNRLAAVDYHLSQGDARQFAAFLRDGRTHWFTKDATERFSIFTYAPGDIRDLVQAAGFVVVDMVGKTVLPMRQHRQLLATAEDRREWGRLEKSLCRDPAAMGRASHLQIVCRVKS